MLFLWRVLIHTVKKRSFFTCNRNLHNCIRNSILVPMLIDIFATGKHVNHGGEYLQCFIFIKLKRPLNSRKNKIVKIEENLNEIIKHCPKENLCKFLARKVLYDLLLDVSAIERSVLEDNVSWDLKMTSAIERCPLYSGHCIEGLL